MLRRLLTRALESAPPADCPGTLPMLVSPHIDLRVDTETYAAAFSTLLRRPTFPETIFILGVGHRCPHEFSLTSARFQTPLGSVEPRISIVESMRQALPFETARGLEGWPGEHSLEFPLLWLQAVRDLAFPGSRFEIVPVLLGGLWPQVLAGSPPEPRTQVYRFGQALLQAARTCSNAALIASIDGCHVGPRFNHPFSGTQARAGVQRWEKQLWDLCASSTHEAWFQHIAAVRNEAYFDGVGVLNLLLCHDSRRARVLCYRLWHESRDQSFVTFTAAVLEPAPEPPAPQSLRSPRPAAFGVKR